MQEVQQNINVHVVETAVAKQTIRMSVAVAVSVTASKRFLSLGF
jgi:hypothetical protein